MKKYQLVLLTVLSGVLLSLPWLELFPGWILFGALVPFFFVEDHFFRRRAILPDISFLPYAFLGFFLWNVMTCWWIAYAAPFGMVIIVLLNALLMAFVWWLYHKMKRNFKSRLGPISLLAFWLAFEYLHYNWDMEWPWLTLGNGFANQVEFIQWYEYSGVMGGSLWILAGNLILFQGLKYVFDGYRLKAAVAYISLFLLLVLFPMVLSQKRYNSYNETGTAYEILILQPNIDPYHEKFKAETAYRQLNILLRLADSLVTSETDFVVGPETALQPMVENEELRLDPQLIPFYSWVENYPKLNIVMGATTRRYFQEGEGLSETARKDSGEKLHYDLYNSALLINRQSDIQIYHKSKLVSGTEKMPFSRYFSFVEKFIVDLGGATGSLGKQSEPTNFISVSDLKVAPIICFESVFGQYQGEFVQQGAGLIFILTNDGWWRDSPGYRQLLAYGRLRAVETRRSVARSANTGISALINQRGDIVKATKWWTEAALKGDLKANQKITFYVQYGDFVGRVSAFVSVLLLLSLLVRKKTKYNH